MNTGPPCKPCTELIRRDGTDLSAKRTPSASVACHSLVGCVSAMSISTTERAACTRCGSVDTNNDTPLGYCSTECYYRQKGQKLLNQLQSDPNTCATCFRPLRHPGLQIVTTDDAPDRRLAFRVDDSGEDAIDEVTHEPTPPRTHRPVLGCSCGTVDTATPSEEVRPAADRPTANRLWRALNRLAAKGAIDTAPDPLAFKAAHQQGVRDFAELAGRGVYGGES